MYTHTHTHTHRISVAEDVGSVEVVVLREQGLVGEVSVVYVVTNVEATNGEDFTVQSLDVSGRHWMKIVIEKFIFRSSYRS